MPFNINDFRGNGLRLGGARPSLFEVKISPANIGEINADAIQKFTFTCRASEVPAATIDPVNVPYFGRQIKLAGDRTFADWTVTVMNDEDYIVRDMFENWSNKINQFVENKKMVIGNDYKSTDAFVTHYSKGGDEIRSYQFVGIFPTTISNMALDWDNTNAIQTFDVTFSYDYWVPIQIGASPAIDTGEPG
jgi:uncharacterized protein YlzI (FlbEa/FlbD family)